MSRHYLWDRATDEVKEATDMFLCSHWFEGPDSRRVARTDLSGGSYVSTVFLGLDHSFGDQGAPVLFETLVFEGPLHGEMERYHTAAEARAGHRRMARRVRAALRREQP